MTDRFETVDGFVLGRESGSSVRAPVGFGPSRAPLVAAPGALIVDNSEGHAIVLAPTGAGKKRNILGPTLRKARNPMLVLDVKGELAAETADWRRELGHEVVVLDVSRPSGQFNPLDVIERSGALVDDANSAAQQLHTDGFSRDPYWDDRSRAFISGLITHVVHSEDEADRSFRRIWKLTHGDDPIYDLSVLVDSIPLHPYARAQVTGLLSLNAEQTRSCILSVIHQHLHIFGSEEVQAATSSTSFDLDAVRSGAPLTVYIVVPPMRLKSHAPLLRLWLSAFMTLLFQRQAPPPQSTLLLLDEVAQLGHMDQILQAMTLARGYGARCLLALQSYAQLRHCYPTEHEVLLENAAVVSTFGHTAFSMSKQLADALGDVTANELFAMRPDQVAIRCAGRSTRIATRADYLLDRDLSADLSCGLQSSP